MSCKIFNDEGYIDSDGRNGGDSPNRTISGQPDEAIEKLRRIGAIHLVATDKYHPLIDKIITDDIFTIEKDRKSLTINFTVSSYTILDKEIISYFKSELKKLNN